MTSTDIISFESVKDVTPEQYFKGSTFAINAFRDKYLVEEFNEKNPAEVFWRVVRYAASAESSKELRDSLAKQWFHQLWTGQWMPAGSILQGAANPNKISLANCTTLGFADDSLESIFDTAYQIAKVAAYRQGLGVHYDLRPRGMKVNNSSKVSEGNTHWMKYFNQIGNVVGQKGRIPAMLFSINDWNPDLLEFITIKSDQKTIENANISVHFSDKFMKTLIDDGIWKMKYVSPTGEELITEKRASEIFDYFVNNNWAFAEPGAQFIDIAHKYSNSDYLGDERWIIKSTNACSEQYLEFLKGKSSGLCMLSSANYMYLFRTFGKDIEAAKNYLRRFIAPSMVRFVDNIITKEIEDKRYPIKEQLNSLKGLRRIGIGVTNLDGYLIYNGIGYDTEQGIQTIYEMTDSFNLGLYETSIALGEEKGSFDAFNESLYTQSPFVKQMMKRHGLKFKTMRNVCVGSIAPTGSLSLMFPDLVSYGIEPIMGLYYWKRARTSGSYEWSFVVPSFVREILKNLNVEIDMQSDSIPDNDGSKGEKIAAIIDKHFPTNKFKPAHLIDPFAKVKLMAKLTKECVDSSISVTYNLPEDVSKETIKNLYIEAWKQGVKSIAIYRDKSRTGIVEFESPRIAAKRYEEKQEEQTEVLLKYSKRPADLPADVHHITVRGEKWIAFVGVNENRPYEIFAGKQDEISLPTKYKSGAIHKDKKNYFFVAGEGEDMLKVNISKSFKNDEHSALTRQVSLNMRHSVPLVYVIDQLDKSHGTIVDYSKVLMRVLKNYLKDEDIKGQVKCKDCGSKNIQYVEKCFVCGDCGSSKCG